ncbi:hypothetical protein [Skermania piniformis]|uniref:Uncharacterized protein n=1 Tax=Skermania pinensis TaxID=39122 RepID=A0ABX8SD88_9ACTN|nr:hypothetical protein [Skermania piniformis]QXQ14570.1 hypothetical protein KV203_03965 [Skermania piniformis]
MPVTRVQIIAEARESSRFTHLIPDNLGQVGPTTLAYLRERCGVGPDEYELMDEFGTKQRFSLASFAHLSPDTVMAISFRSGSADREFPPLEPGEVLLKDYLVEAVDS